MNNQMILPDLNRRTFLRGTSVAAIMQMLGGVELRAQSAAPESTRPVGATVKCAVIGLGTWGREIVTALGRVPEAQIAAICDTYPAMLRRAASAAPNATQIDEYKKILDDKSIQAVVIATPTHKHKDLVLEALQAGKHVYCEAPIANTIEDAKAIAMAAKQHKKQVFQAGLQSRSDPQRHYVLGFMRTGAAGTPLFARSQFHKKQSWRQPAATAEREKDLNWRLDSEISLGLIGEIGIHQLDAATWFLNSRPIAVTGFGSTLHWTDDGRTVPDTVQAVVQFPGGVNYMYDCTLGNSFDAGHEMYYGSFAAVMVRENKAWMFKESDSPLLGWEVYARKDAFYKESGIALMMNATKLVAQGDNPVEDPAARNTPLQAALEAFLLNVNEISGGVEDFAENFPDNKDSEALAKYLSELALQPAAGYKEGYESAVFAIKANEAITKGQRVELKKEMFALT